MAKTHVVQAQTALAAAGYYGGKIDGDFGGGSLRAVQNLIDNTDKAVDILSKPDIVEPVNKKLSKDDIVAAAKELNVEPAVLKAVIDVEAAGDGFDNRGRPTILFEPHIFWDQLGKIHYYTKRAELQKSHPGILSPTWDKSLYRIGGTSHDKLKIAAELNWEAAHKSASWGLGQIMGFNFSSIGYATLKEFIDDMYESEAKQLKAMGMFLKANNLIGKLQRHDWAGFARGYNGSAYAKNQYDVKLATAYNLAKKQGW